MTMTMMMLGYVKEIATKMADRDTKEVGKCIIKIRLKIVTFGLENKDGKEVNAA